MAKEKFKSKAGFIFASIGAAVGLGNALRFPGLCAKYGGGAFLLIYFIALVILGIPLLNAEIALGRKIKSGAPRCMASLTAKRPITGLCAGWTSSINSLITAIIYAGLAGWIVAACVNIVPLCVSAPEMTQTEISSHFFQNVLSARNDGVIDGISPAVICAVIFVWVLLFFFLKGGANALSKAAKITVVVPVLLLIFMAVRGIAYENSKAALAALFVPDFSKLSSPEIWLSALGQVFFSLSAAVGIMPVYGAYLPEGTNIFSCSLFIAAADFLVSVLASVVMFTTLYGCGLRDRISDSGIITAFAVYPAAIAGLFGGNTAANCVAGVLFYASLAMMSIQAAVSMLEAFAAPCAEETGKPRKKISAALCIAGGIVSLMFATTAAPVIVDISDKYVNFYNVLILAAVECVIIGFSGKTRVLADEINKFTGKIAMPAKLFVISVKFLCPVVLISLTALEVYRLLSSPSGYPIWLNLAFGWGLSFAVFGSGIAAGVFTSAPRLARFKRKSRKLSIT